MHRCTPTDVLEGMHTVTKSTMEPGERESCGEDKGVTKFASVHDVLLIAYPHRIHLAADRLEWVHTSLDCDAHPVIHDPLEVLLKLRERG